MGAGYERDSGWLGFIVSCMYIVIAVLCIWGVMRWVDRMYDD